jgi:hypothetical protein
MDFNMHRLLRIVCELRIHAIITAVAFLWRDIGTGHKGPTIRLRLNKTISLHDALSKGRKKSHRKTGDVILGVSKAKRSGKYEARTVQCETFREHRGERCF